MTEKISLAELTHDAETAGPPSAPYLMVAQSTVLALVKAVELARTLQIITAEHSLDNDVTPFDTHTDYVAASFALGETLDGFDFGAADSHSR